MSLIAQNIIVQHSGTTILDGVSFRANRGDFIGIIGPNNSEPSALLHALSGFRPLHKGDLSFDGMEISKHVKELKSDIGFVPQHDIHNPLKVERALGYAADLRLTEMPPKERIERIEEILQALGIWEQRDLKIGSLSKAQRIRVNIAMELLTQPTILFADEPTKGLESSSTHDIMCQLRQRADDENIVIMTTDIMNPLRSFDKLCVLYKGHLVFFGPPDELQTYFSASDLIEVYSMLKGSSPSALKLQFLDSPLAHNLKA